MCDIKHECCKDTNGYRTAMNKNNKGHNILAVFCSDIKLFVCLSLFQV